MLAGQSPALPLWTARTKAEADAMLPQLRALHATDTGFQKRIRRGDHFRGYSITAERMVDFDVRWPESGDPNWRETVRCPETELISRLRAAYHAYRTIRPEHSEDRIYLTEAVTAFFRFMTSRCSGTIGSEYLADVPFGTKSPAGVRSEDLTSLRFDDASFDIVMSFEVLEHVPDYRAALCECARVLKPGGIALLTAPFLNLVIEGTGVVLYGRGGVLGTSKSPKEAHVTFDLTGTSFVEVRNLYIVGAPDDPPRIGFLNARGQDLGGTGGNVINNSLIFCHTEGKFRFAAYVALCTDLQTETGCRFVNDLNDQVDVALAALTQPRMDGMPGMEGVSYAGVRLNYWLHPDVIDSAWFQGGKLDANGNPMPGINLTKDRLHSFQASVVDTCSFIKKNGDGWSLLLTAYGPQTFRNCYANSARGMRMLMGNRSVHNCQFDIHHEGGKVRLGEDDVLSDHPLRWATLAAIPRLLPPAQGQTAFLTNVADFRGCTFREPSMTMDENFMNISDASLVRVLFTGGGFDLPRKPSGGLMTQLFSAPEKVSLYCDMLLGEPGLLGDVAVPPSRLRWPGGEQAFPPAGSDLAILLDRADFTLDFAATLLPAWSRASPALRTGANGRLETVPADTPRLDHDANGRVLGLLVEPASTNLHLWSKSFATPPWSPTALTVTSAAVIAPDGSGQAVVVVPTTATAAHALNTDISDNGSGTSYVKGSRIIWSIHAKASGYTKLRLLLVETVATVNHRVYVDFDLSTGVAGAPISAFTDPPVTPTPSVRASMARAGPDGWFRCTLALEKLDDDSPTLRAQLYVLDGTNQSFAGDGVKGIAIWGSQVELGVAGATSYIPTENAAGVRVADLGAYPLAPWFTHQAGAFVVEGSYAPGPPLLAEGGVRDLWRIEGPSPIALQFVPSPATLRLAVYRFRGCRP